MPLAIRLELFVDRRSGEALELLLYVAQEECAFHVAHECHYEMVQPVEKLVEYILHDLNLTTTLEFIRMKFILSKLNIV